MSWFYVRTIFCFKSQYPSTSVPNLHSSIERHNYFQTSNGNMTWIIQNVNRILTHCGVAYESVHSLVRGHVIRACPIYDIINIYQCTLPLFCGICLVFYYVIVTLCMIVFWQYGDYILTLECSPQLNELTKTRFGGLALHLTLILLFGDALLWCGRRWAEVVSLIQQ